MEIANLVCRSSSGDNELLDIFEEYFYPALKYQEIPGSHNSETIKYKFINLKLKKIENELVLYGKLVQCLNIEREQILEGENLIESYDSLDSAPSSFFVLILRNHKLLWIREMTRAPKLSNLRSILKRALKQQRDELINTEYSSRISHDTNDKEKYLLKQELNFQYPSLDIEITPLVNKVQIENSLNEFDCILDLQIKALRRNNELGTPFSNLLNNLSSTQEGAGAKHATVNIHGDQKNPLNKNVVSELAQVASDGNYEYKIVGKDDSNNSIVKDQNNLSLTTSLVYDDIAGQEVKNVKNMINKYVDAVNKYNTLPQQLTDNQEKLREIEKKINE